MSGLFIGWWVYLIVLSYFGNFSLFICCRICNEDIYTKVHFLPKPCENIVADCVQFQLLLDVEFFYVVFNKLYYVSCWVSTIELQDSLLEIFCEMDFEEVNFICLRICWQTETVWSYINLCIITNEIVWKLDSAASSVNQQNYVHQSSEWNDTIDYCLHLFYLYLYKYIFNVIEVACL